MATANTGKARGKRTGYATPAVSRYGFRARRTEKQESRSRRLVTIRVTPMTYRHLCAMAEVSGLKYPGQAVDKLVRSLALQARELRRKDER